MKILITGGLGFLGTNLALVELKNDNTVFVLDNIYKEVGVSENKVLLEKGGALFLYADIRNAFDVEYIFKEHNFDIVYHCAAQVAFKRSVLNPRLDFEINALGTFNLLEAIRKFNQDTILIYASTNQVYGSMTDIQTIEKETRYIWTEEPFASYGISENRQLDFLSPYGCSKGTGDQYCIDYSRVFNLNTVVLRLSGIYGEHQYSYEDHGWISFISKMIHQNLSFNRYGNGKQVRDVLYVSDIVNAFSLAVKNIDNARGHAFNIGGGMKNTLSVLELIKLVEELTGNKEKSIVNSMRTADKLIYISDIRKAHEYLNWEPKISYSDGIEKLINWFKTI